MSLATATGRLTLPEDPAHRVGVLILDDPPGLVGGPAEG